jgi:hypothetical protein
VATADYSVAEVPIRRIAQQMNGVTQSRGADALLPPVKEQLTTLSVNTMVYG